jgi:trans-2-enoyl-CoA reductase
MSKSLKAAIYQTHGLPADVLQIVEQPWPEPAPDEVVVRMAAAPINPADLNAIEGKYPIRPTLPATPGMEGAGTIVEVGSAVRNLTKGALVILPHSLGTWREACAVLAKKLVVVSGGIEPIQAAMLKVNPVTAWRMLHDFVSLQKGDWVIQNAANSGAGRAVIQIARGLGLKTVNIVRRAELVEELRAEGGDVVLVDGENLRDDVAAQTQRAEIRLALNAVGGESAIRMAKTLAPDATIVTYGAMSLQPMSIPNGMLIFKNLRFTGFWVNKWYDGATAQQRAETFAPLFDMAQRGLLHAKVEKTYPLEEAQAAIAHASKNKRSGKIVFAFDA